MDVFYESKTPNIRVICVLISYRFQPMSDVEVINETPTTNRKKPFRCTSEEDIYLLRAVVARFPYGADHGSKEALWEKIRTDFSESVSVARRPLVPGIDFC